MPLPQRSLAVVGVNHPNERGPTRRFEIETSHPGEPVELRLEPKNKADPHAIVVYSCRDVQIGYLRAEDAPWIGSIIRDGREVRAVFQHRAEWGAVVRAAFDGDAPTIEGLPAARAARPAPQEEQEFWPDPEWPNE